MKTRRWNEHSELVPNQDGIVYGPSRAEIILACLGAGALAPFICLGSCMALGIAEGITRALAHPLLIAPRCGKDVLTATGTGLFVSVFIFLKETLRPRKLLLVRARVFEPDKSPKWQITLIAVYAAIVLIALKA